MRQDEADERVTRWFLVCVLLLTVWAAFFGHHPAPITATERWRSMGNN
jgi:hypothetical protein